jgi:hypothetical protein
MDATSRSRGTPSTPHHVTFHIAFSVISIEDALTAPIFIR